ncbi:unnamed protein product [Knipowitschia caucasica]|uniref:Uncharacterized protein n=1 Tax=Knipowitschia caucasica TaxID=637954 RepID=A0AAV2JSJ8_KNICA
MLTRSGPVRTGHHGGPWVSLLWGPLLLLLLCASSVCANYSSQSGECRGKGRDCTDLSQRKSDLRVCDEWSCRYGGVCKEDGGQLKCVCHFQCDKDYTPVCGSNGDTYQNECYRRQASCKQQRLISKFSEGPCNHEPGSGSGDSDDTEGSSSDGSRKFTKCSTCKYGAECDEDSEDVWCICNLDCSGHNQNPVCATDGHSYFNPCLVREASCMKQEQIDVQHLGFCTADKEKTSRKDDSSLSKSLDGVVDPGEGPRSGSPGSPLPCPNSYAAYCVHGTCELRYSSPACRCDAGYKGPQCSEPQDFNVLYVVPSGQKLHYVLIAAIIGAVQIAIIAAVVLCITRKCPKNQRGRRHKQNLGHFPSESNSRMV